MIYLDNASTTKVSDKSAEKALYIMKECYGNPSSLHDFGFNAQKELDKARALSAKALGVDSKNIIFTSGATESNNIAINSAVKSLTRYGKKIVTSTIEHPSVLEPIKMLEKDGFEVVYIKPNEKGEIDKEDVINAIDKNTILVSLMSVNNETGARLPLEVVFQAIKNVGSHAVFHVDNVQGVHKIKLDIKKLGINFMSISGHKIHAPKGVGLLYHNAKVVPLVVGGGQENGMRSGTENLPAIVAMAESLSTKFKISKINEIGEYLKEAIKNTEGLTLNSPDNSCNHIVNFSLNTVRGETMMHFLARKNIYISTGSACSGSKGSHVLNAMGFEPNRILTAVRVSISEYNSKEDIDKLINEIILGLRSIKG